MNHPASTVASAAQGPTAELVARLSDRLGSRYVITGQSEKRPYEAGARHGAGVASVVVLPATREDLAWVVKELVQAGVHFVPQGAVTGLVAAATPSKDGSQWIVSTQRLRDVLEIDVVNRSATIAAGYRLSDLNQAAAQHGLCFPIDLGADPSIGGMVATNTGGARLIRYGGVRENLLDVEAVLAAPAGQQVGGSCGLRKNNTGLSWPQLLCGTFGAFGVVSRATVKLHPVTQQVATALLSVDCVDSAMRLLCALESGCGEFVSAFEGISGDALRVVARHLDDGLQPFAEATEYAVLVELSSAIGRSRGLDLDALLVETLERQLDAGLVLDAIVGKPEQIWRIRHCMSEAVQSLGRMVAFDLAVSRSKFAPFRTRCIELVKSIVPDARICDFGHLGDGGVHLNMVVPDTMPDTELQRLRDTVYDTTVREFGGSFSAEHGVGPYNQRWYQRYLDHSTRDWARMLHGHFDPAGVIGNVRLD